MLNSSQRNHFRRVLAELNRNLRELEDSLARDGVDEVVYRWRNPLPLGQREDARAVVGQIRAALRRVAKENDLSQIDDQPLDALKNKFLRDWTELEESKSSALKRFGDVDPRLKYSLDPEVVALQIMIQRLNGLLSP